MWSKIASHVKLFCTTWQNYMSFGAILSCESMTNCSTFLMGSDLSLLHMTNLQCMLSCCELRCFDATSILSHFMHFCVEQKSTHKSCLWSKNYKHHVCSQDGGLIVTTSSVHLDSLWETSVQGINLSFGLQALAYNFKTSFESLISLWIWGKWPQT